MALSAALPVTWSPIVIYFGITLILGLLDWTGLARAVRSKLLALREEDFCVAAELMGAKPRRSEEHTSELQSLMRTSYDVFCLNNKHNIINSIVVLFSNGDMGYTTTQNMKC